MLCGYSLAHHLRAKACQLFFCIHAALACTLRDGTCDTHYRQSRLYAERDQTPPTPTYTNTYTSTYCTRAPTVMLIWRCVCSPHHAHTPTPTSSPSHHYHAQHTHIILLTHPHLKVIWLMFVFSIECHVRSATALSDKVLHAGSC